MQMRKLPFLAASLLAALLAPLVAGATLVIDCPATLPIPVPADEPPVTPIGGDEAPTYVTNSCQDFCVMVVQACLAACPGTEYNACRHACYDDYATCVNGCWEDEVPEGP